MSIKEPISHVYNCFLKSQGISTDSRNVIENSIFFSLKGDNFDGNSYAIEALEKGAKFAVVDDNKIDHSSDNIILVEDCLEALQELAKYHRSKLDIPVIGITGSNGKTTTKNLLYEVLSTKYKTYATKGNLNNHIGVPLSILEIDNTYDIAIIEMGASGVGEIEQLSTICNPTSGLITNISSAHIKGFKNIEGVVRGKSELFDFLIKTEGDVFINNNDSIINNFSKRFKAPLLLFGKNSILSTTLLQSVPNIILQIGENIKVESNLFGNYNYENIVFALSIGKHYGVTEESASLAIRNFSPIDNRSQSIKVKSNTVLLDAYNANPASMSNALESLSNFNKNRIAILGDMLELGDISKYEHEKIGRFILDLKIEKVFFVGSRMKNAFLNCKESYWYDNKKDLEMELKNTVIKESVVLIKGSRNLKLESLLAVIEKISI